MERLTSRLWILGVVVLGMAVVVQKLPPAAAQAIDEKWMEEKAPLQVSGYTFQPGYENPAQSYKMGKVTYDTLQPAGIVSRIYTRGNERYDVVLIASDNSRSFHDPRVCFTATGWNITKQTQSTIKTKTRGDVPVTFVKMNNNGRESSALYFFRGPKGFEAQARNMRLSMFVSQVTKIKNEQGVFYRIIPDSPWITDEQLLAFAGEYLDAAEASSNGFF